uniref:Retrotransposon Copia-like N-terminal domain-containing protein n=1 Tax=Solanum lycopersicum TaxID=4081 RepID=A0A3Q7JBG9_SOLLC
MKTEGHIDELASLHQPKVTETSLFFFLPPDHQGLIFVTNPLSENGENYFTWRRNLFNLLHSKNETGFVNGTIGWPNENSKDLQSWIEYNYIVLSCLINAIAKELQGRAAHIEKAREIWVDPEEQFNQGIAPRFYELKRAIALLKQERASISSYYGKLMSVWGELQGLVPTPSCTCGCICGVVKKMQSMMEEEKIFDFLIGLDNTYSTIHSQIQSVDPLPNIRRAYAITTQEENRELLLQITFPQLKQLPC